MQPLRLLIEIGVLIIEIYLPWDLDFNSRTSLVRRFYCSYKLIFKYINNVEQSCVVCLLLCTVRYDRNLL